MDTEMTRYESFAEVTEDFYCSAVDVLKILVLRLHDYHARCFHSLRDALYDCFSTDTAPHTHQRDDFLAGNDHRGCERSVCAYEKQNYWCLPELR